MSWTRRIWQNFPSLSTAISASALNNIEEGVEEAVTATRGRLSDANLTSTFVRFLDENGDPLVGKLVTITVDSSVGTILDITSEEI